MAAFFLRLGAAFFFAVFFAVFFAAFLGAFFFVAFFATLRFFAMMAPFIG
ncbi:MAG: hypothetical protein NWS59_01940 [Ilumatobacteraceae bacterium]|nr:hypothetical protein [Ilumatobacteraceae bacterium]